MGRYVVRRLLWTVLVMLWSRSSPSRSSSSCRRATRRSRSGKQPTPEMIAEVEKQLGLDKPASASPSRRWSGPWDSQYSAFLGRLYR